MQRKLIGSRIILSLFLSGTLLAGMMGCGNTETDPNSALHAPTAENAAEGGDAEERPGTADTNDNDGGTDSRSDGFGPSVQYSEIQDSYSPEELQKLSSSYSFYNYDETTYKVNGYGRIVSDATYVTFRALEDVMTEEVAGYAAEYREYSKIGEWYYSTGSVRSRLYSAEGELLRDWEEIVYEDYIGSWVTAHDYYDLIEGIGDVIPNGYLLNPKTGEKGEGYFYLEKLNDAYAVVEDCNYSVIGVVNASGKPMVPIPMQVAEMQDDSYVDHYKDYITIYNESESRMYIYTPRMKLLGYLSNSNSRTFYEESILGPYVCEEGSVYDPSVGTGGELKPVFQADEVIYYDGEVAIIREEQIFGDPLYWLYDVKAQKKISDAFRELCYPIIGDGYERMTENVQEFYGIDAAGEYLVKLDRNGNVQTQVPAQGTMSLTVHETGIIGTEYHEVYDPTMDYAMLEYSACLMDRDLQMIIPYGTYESIYRPYNQDSSVWTGYYYLPGTTQMRGAILDSSGQAVLDGCSDIYSSEDGYFRVRRGSSYGVVDPEGNWIFRYRREELDHYD